ncbi:MAG: NAD(P)-dependent oxidoreductase [Clostridia bacterium]|nr:NAD(P)-dependent oxidoreductase [Clostridia bacterium]
MKRVLVTGCKGRIGSMLMRGLRRNPEYEVVATARDADPEEGILSLDLRDPEAAKERMRGVDTVVHMAAFLGAFGFEDKIIPNNVLGTYHLFEAMRENGCRRMVNGSTNHVIGFYRTSDRIDGDSPPRPDTLYGLGKAMVEVMGQYYADKHGISCINIRIGHYSVPDRPLSPIKTLTWISQRDMLQLVERCIDAPESVRFLNVFGVSGNTGRFWTNEGVRELIGYEPQDDGTLYLEEARRTDWWKVPGEDRFRDDNGYMGMDFVTMTGMPNGFPPGRKPAGPSSADNDADAVRNDGDRRGSGPEQPVGQP